MFAAGGEARDVAASPYLALGALVRAGLEGLRRELPVPEPTAVDPETLPEDERARRGIVRLPQSLDEALDALAGDAAAKMWFPEVLFDAYLRHKRFEARLMAELDRGARCTHYSQAY